jgi:cystathionine beta-lyase
LKRFQNALGPVLGPIDCFLLSRGIKTLKLRLEEGEKNAAELARRLEGHPAVARVIYPGLESFAQRELHFSQATGAGAVLTFELHDAARVKPLLETVALPIISPSLGGVETILTHCWSMSHAAIPAETKQAAGIGPGLLRISAGIEDIEDLWEDLAAGLAAS